MNTNHNNGWDGMGPEDQRLITPTNQYLGINAHLHSHFLHHDPQGWEEFHSDHITDLTRAMNEHLLALGYIARKERSLQIRYFDGQDHHPIPDVLISDLPARDRVLTPRQDFGSLGTAQAMSVPATALLEYPESETKRPSAIKIYEQDAEGEAERGKPVAWIELLSPSNKSGTGYVEYVAKRDALLANRLVFVEMDYLHGTSTTLDKVPDYRPPGRDQQPDASAHPYHLWLIDPRLPQDDPRSGAIAAFDADQPVPTITIPLNHGDQFTFDFNAVYHQTFRAQPAYSLAVDYRQSPEDVLHDYNRRDQVAVAARMLTVQKLQREGADLAQRPYPVEPTLLNALYRTTDLVYFVGGELSGGTYAAECVIPSTRTPGAGVDGEPAAYEWSQHRLGFVIMITAAVSRSKSYVYALPSMRYRVAFSTAATVRAFAFFSKSTVYPFWFFHLNPLFEDDTQVADRMKRYTEDVAPIAGLHLADVSWDELVADLRSPVFQRGFMTLCHHTFFNSGTEQERWLARGASLVELRRLKEQAQLQNDWLLTEWLDQAIRAAESDPVTFHAAAQVTDTYTALTRQLSRFSLDGELTVYWGLFTDDVHLRRGYVAYGGQVRWTYLGAEFAAAQSAVTAVNDRFHLGSMSP